ncbi:hypothetical protein [Pseudosulfitobacter sp. SM2401]|jgi:hypothetical protein|uniref:hypothetical protein n=1 Tax=Pseudosulfitobacter sp. SM2401 TaxID=3350098 RepID=UPI0036F31AE1
MHKKFIATIAAASILITGFAAAPAYAGNDDAKRALAALLGVAIIGAVIHDARKDEKSRVHRPQVQPHKRPKANKRPHVQPRPLPKRVNKKLLPGQCMRTIENRRGNRVRAFGLRCLEKNYRFVNRLPNHCFRSDRTRKGVRHGFGARCLRAEGYRLAHN